MKIQKGAILLKRSDKGEDPVPVLKERLAAEILEIVGCYHWMTAARLLGIDFARMCHLRKGRLDRFSLQILIRMLANVNRQIDFTVVNRGPAHIEWIRELYPHLANPLLSRKREGMG